MSDILVGLSEKEKGEIIRFGIERGKILLVSSIGIFLLGGIFNVLGESLVFFFSLYSLRIYAGGYHAKSQKRCFMLSLIIVSAGFISIKHLLTWNYTVLIFVSLMAEAIIWKLAPVENQNKLLDEAEQKEYAKKTRIILLCQGCILLVSYYFQLNTVFMGGVLGIFVVCLGVISGKIQIVWMKKGRGCEQKRESKDKKQ